MIVSEIIKYIWSDERKQFNKMLESTSSFSEKELFELAAKNEMILYTYPGTNMNLLPCPICSYRFNNDFSGCSMCDYEKTDMLHKAILTSLREKNVDLYVKAVVQSFRNVRGDTPIPEAFELISSYDVFSDDEFPEELFYELFKANQLFQRNPFCYIFETRASSVSLEKLALIRKYIPEGSRIMIEFGVEVANEWVRNHWINKSVTNVQIINAINLIHSMGYKASADVLIGIPGFTEEQSIKCFCDTVLWLNDIGIDHIVVLPLNRKKRTLQGAMYTYLRDDQILNDKGLVQKEHTGIPWLTTIVRSIYEVINADKDVSRKLDLAQLYPHQNSVDNVTAYNSKECKCNDKVRNALKEYQKTRNDKLIVEAVSYSMSDKHECSREYVELLRKQSNISIADTTYLIINSLCKCFWPKQSLNKIECFSRELNLLKGKSNE